MKKYLIAITFTTLFLSCEKEKDIEFINFKNDFKLIIENNEALADGISTIKVRAEFPEDFTTEDDNKVKFLIYKEEIQEKEIDILLVDDNGQNKKRATLFISNDKKQLIDIEAILSINSVNISKNSQVSFKKAYLDSINIFSSSLTIKPNSFEEIEFTTELIRNIGIASVGSFAETKVIDTLGIERGLFNNYKNFSNEESKIVNKYTLGNDDYLGELFAISSGYNEQNEIKIDTITILSKN
mgnify:CR=1 FL=1